MGKDLQKLPLESHIPLQHRIFEIGSLIWGISKNSTTLIVGCAVAVLVREGFPQAPSQSSPLQHHRVRLLLTWAFSERRMALHLLLDRS